MSAIALFGCTLVAAFMFGLVTAGTRRVAFLTTFAIGAAYLVILRFLPVVTTVEVAAYLLGGPCGIVLAMSVQRTFRRCVAELHLLTGHGLEDPWSERIAEYLEGRAGDRVTVAEILERALTLDRTKWDRSAQMRIVGELRGRGWARVRDPRSPRQWSYMRPQGR